MDNKTINSFSDLNKHIEFVVEFPEPKRGEIYLCDFSDIAIGTINITIKSRPALIIQNDRGNKFGNTVIVAVMTSKEKKKIYPMHYRFSLNSEDSTIMFEQIVTLDKVRLIKKLGELTPEQMLEAEDKLMYSLDLNRFSLSNVKDIEVISELTTKTKDKNYLSYGIDIIFADDTRHHIDILLDKLKQFDPDIEEGMELYEIKCRLDSCKGLNFLVKNIR
jgi:mRNA interferase MazF